MCLVEGSFLRRVRAIASAQIANRYSQISIKLKMSKLYHLVLGGVSWSELEIGVEFSSGIILQLLSAESDPVSGSLVRT